MSEFLEGVLTGCAVTWSIISAALIAWAVRIERLEDELDAEYPDDSN